MKKVLIIGSKGMLGQELVNVFLRDKDYELTSWDREELDVTKQRQAMSKITKLKPNIIINATAYNAVDKIEEGKKDLEMAKKLNGLAPSYLAEAAKKLGAIFVHYSTDYVFDGNPEFPEPAGCAGSCSSCSLHEGFVPQIGFTEDDKPRPIQQYGKTKLAGEKAVKKVFGKKGVYYVIRISKLFGKPAISKDSKRSFFDVMLEVGKKNKEVKVVDEETSCFTYAPDCAKKTKEIIESEKPSGIYHVTNSDPCTWYEAVKELYRQAKLKTKIVSVSASEFPRPAKRPFFSALINTKLHPMRSYKLALREYLKEMNK